MSSALVVIYVRGSWRSQLCFMRILYDDLRCHVQGLIIGQYMCVTGARGTNVATTNVATTTSLQV